MLIITNSRKFNVAYTKLMGTETLESGNESGVNYQSRRNLLQNVNGGLKLLIISHSSSLQYTSLFSSVKW